MTLDDVSKIVQIAFWVVASTVAILTYIKAKRGLLNTVNTEYQKRVMDRLAELSKKLYAEFELDSQEHWIKRQSFIPAMKEMREEFLQAPETCGKGKWQGGIPHPKEMSHLASILEPLVSDPFVPKVIRDEVVTLLKERLDVFSEVYFSVVEEYGTALIKGKVDPANNMAIDGYHNKGIERLNERGCGIEDIQKEVHEIRLKIQQYFESFIPR